MKRILKSFKKRLANRLAVPRPISSLSPDNLYAFLDALFQTRNLNGPVVEIGCAYGGTTAIAYHLLTRIQSYREYVCIDTFSGFVDSHLKTDYALGLHKDHARRFSDNSLEQVRKNLYNWGVSKRLHLIKADISAVSPQTLPDRISVCLIDVDLRDPIFDALNLLTPRLALGGVILVDDCKEGTSWVGANVGYMDFVQAHGITPRYFMGFGVIDKDNTLSWDFSEHPNASAGSFYNKNVQY